MPVLVISMSVLKLFSSTGRQSSNQGTFVQRMVLVLLQLFNTLLDFKRQSQQRRSRFEVKIFTFEDLCPIIELPNLHHTLDHPLCWEIGLLCGRLSISPIIKWWLPY